MMAVVPCSDCGSDVSTSAVSCPSCGASPASRDSQESEPKDALDEYLASLVSDRNASVSRLSDVEAMVEITQGPGPVVLAALSLGFSRRIIPTKRYYRVTVNNLAEIRSVDTTVEVQRARESWGGR